MSHIRSALARAGLAAALLAGTSLAATAQDVLNRGNGTDPETLDVHRSTGVPESWIQLDLFEGLTTVDAKGEVIPGVAESWDISDDGLTWTFHLRPDALWSDGSPLTAEDFVFSWRRLVDPATASDYAYFLWPVANGEAISKGETPVDQLGARAVDDHTFEVTLRTPTPYLPSALAHHSTYAVSKANVEQFGDEYIRPGNLVSNGAYTLAEYVPQGYIRLEKNPRFHDADNVAIETVMYYPTEDQDAELQRYRAGELDIAYETPAQQTQWIKDNLGDQYHETPYFGTYFYTFNLLHEPWASQPALREALSLALDRDILTSQVSQGGEIPAYSFVPPGTAGYAAQDPEYAGWTQAQRDERAKELFAEAGYGPDNPLQVAFVTNTNDNHRKMAVAAGAMWKQKLGVELSIENLEWGVFLDERDEKTFQDIARHGWIGDYNDANNFLELLRSDIGPQNPAAYENPEFDRLMKEAAAEADTAHRAELMQEAERIMLADFPIIPIYFYASNHLVSPRVVGWEDNVNDFHPSRFMSIAQQ